MFKRISIFFVSMMMIFTSITPLYAKNSPDIGLIGPYGIIIDNLSGEVLYQKNIHEKMYPASITKILTIITAIEMIKDTKATVTITDKDLETVFETGASAANFEVGEVVTYEDILMGAMIPSGADATRALANNLCGDQDKFVKKMNQLAQKLKCKDSHFVNTTGIHDPNHYTTVSDMAIITRYALKNPEFKKLFGVNVYTSSNKIHIWTKKVTRNAKRSGLDISSIKGCKSGYTVDAQHTLSSLVEVDGHEYVAVVGHCQDANVSSSSVVDTINLSNYVKNNYQTTVVKKQGDQLKSVPVSSGKKETLKVTCPEDISIVLPKQVKKSKLKYDYQYKDLTAPIKKGSKIGTLRVSYNKVEKAKITLVAQESIKKETSILKKLANLFFPYGFAIILICLFIALIKVSPTSHKKR